MANKALKAARKAYNRSKSTKNRIDIETGKKIKKKKKQETKSHYGQTEQTNKKIGGTNAKKAHEKNKTDKNPVKAHYGQVESKTRSTTGSLGTKISNAYKSNVDSAQKNKSKVASSHFGQVTQTKVDVSTANAKKRFGIGTYSTANAKKAKTNSDKAQEKLNKKGEKTVQTLSNADLKAEQDKAEDRAKRETAWYTRQLMVRGKMTQDEADEAVKKAGENARKKTKEDHSLTYSNATMSNEDILREMNAAPHANVKVKDTKEADKAKREARFYTNREVAAGNMTQEEADKIVKQAGKGHWTTQSANILDKLGGEGTAEESGTRQAGQMNDSKFFSGVLQGMSYGDNTRAIGKYNQQAAELVDTVKNSGAFNAGYMVGQGGQFLLGGTNKMTDALVKGVAKSGALRSALNIGVRKGAADIAFETPLNTLDALKMSRDANGNIDKNAFVKYMALNSGLSGGIGSLIGGAGSKLAKNDAKSFIALSAKANSGASLTEQEVAKLANLQKKFDSIRQGNDVAKTDIVNRADYDAEVGKKVFEKGGTVDDAIKTVNGGSTHTEKIGYANSIKETANAQFEQLRTAREQMLEQAKTASPEEAKVLRQEASKLGSEISRLGEIANTAERQLAIELKRNKKAVTELTQNVKAMSEATGINYRVVNDKDMKKLISEAGGDVSDDYFYKGFYYKNKNGETEILINSDSPQAHQTVIGHETGHLIKSANEKEFDDLGNMLEEYAKKNDDFDAVYNQLKRSYPDATEAELREEVTCELLGRYVYGADDKFIKQLAGEKPSVVQRIVDYLKKLVNGTSDKEMAKELQAIIDKTEGLIKNINGADAETPKFSIVKNVKATDGVEYENVVKLDTNKFNSIRDKQTRANEFRDFVFDELAGKKFNAQDSNGNTITIEFARATDKHKKDGAKQKNKTLNEIAVKSSKKSRSKETQVAVSQADELIEVSKHNGSSPTNAHGDLDANGWDYRTLTIMSENGNLFNGVLNIAKSQDGRNILYDVKLNKIGVASRTTQGGSAPSNLDKNIPQGNEPVNGKYSKENIGYHAGDLGKAEPRARMSSGRGTGHYGTGTYFVGNKAKISDDYYGKRPVETVDFTKYKMWKPLLKSDASELHDFLKKVNTYWSVIDSPLNSFDAVWNFQKRGNKIYDDFFDVKYDIRNGDTFDTDIPIPQKTLNEYGEQYKKLFDETGTDHIYEKIVGDEFDGNYTEDIIYSLAEQFERSDYRESDWIKFADDMKKNTDPESFGMLKQADFLFRDNPNGINVTPQKLKKLLEEVKKDMETDTLPHDVQDSASTRLMKKLGYEGVDVRGTDMDNTYGGSVIYDLKDEDLARKKEIGTARFSKESKPKAETPTEAKPKPEETKSEPVAEDSAGYTTHASPRLKAMTNTAKEYGVDVTSRVDEFNSLGKQIKGDRAHIANVKKSTKYATEAEREARIAELETGIEKANVLQTQIAESIYRDVADARKALGDKMGWSPKSIDTASAKEIRTATENIGGVGTMANDIKKANKGSGSKKAQKLVAEEIKDYDDCLDKYLKGGEDPDMQNARASALLENIAERLSKNQDDADAMSDLMKVVDKLSEDGTLPSNVRSSAKILATSTPKGRVGVALKAVEDLNKKYGENIDGTLKLTDEEKVKLATTTGEELDDLYKEITDRLWDNIPATRIEKANEIRHMFMLTNVRTHARNMFGNLSFRGVRHIADDIEVQLQTRVFKNAIEKRGGEVDRVKVKKSEIRENEKYLTDEFHAIYDTSDSVNRYIETNRPDGVPIVKQKQLNWLIQKDYKLLEKEDMMTFIPAFRKSYMQYVNAKGWDISNMTEAQKKMARERALFDAEYATFRDTSALSAWLTGKKHQLATKQGKTIWETGAYRLGNVALEGLMPFVKTPVNIFRRSVDYSPISLVRCIGELASKDVDTFKQGIKHLSTGLTGTGVFGLGVFLADNDYISIDTQLGSHSGSKYYDQDMGYQDYSLVINIGGIHQSWTIDWLQPMQASLFMGAAFNDMWGDVHDGEGNLGTDTISALFAITSPMLDASFMSSTKDMIETFQRRAGQETAEGEPDMAGALAQALFGDLPKNYISSAVPQLISQSANVIDPYKRDTRSTIEDPILASWDSAGKQMLNRIPVLRQKLLNPKIDRWGDDVKTGNNVAIRLFNSMLNPSNVKEITENKYDRELIKIRNNGTEKGSNDYKFFFYNFTGNPQYDLANGKRMNYKELYDYGKSNRIEQTNRVHDMVDSKSYDGMTWDMRAKEVDNAHWIGNMVADHDTYGVNYAIKAMKKSTSSRDESDAKAYERYVANAGKNKDNEKFWDYRVNKERMYSRAHATGDDTYRIKGLCAIQTGDDNLVKSLNLKGGKEEDARKYWKLVKSEFGKKAKDQAFKEVTDGCCFIESNLKTAKVEGTDLGIKSAAAGVSAKNGNKIDERVYRFLGHFWNSAQAGGGLQLKYNKNGKYDLKALEAMSDQLDAKIEARPKGMSQKDVVCDFIENDLKITNADEAACVYQSLYLKGNGKRWKNPYADTIKDWLEWGDNHDDEWGVKTGGSGGGRGRRGRRGRGGGGGGSSKGTMPSTDTGAIKGKVTDVFSTSNGSKDSNLNDAYRKRARKLRESTNK